MSNISTVLALPPAPPHLANDPVLRRAKEGLHEIYGDRLAGAIVYGSRARGENRFDSDYDIVVLIKGYNPDRESNKRLHELSLALFSFGPPEVEVNFLPLEEKALERRTIFMHNVRDEGFRL